MRRTFAVPVILLGCGLSNAAWADPLPDNFTLGGFVPDSCTVYVHRVNNPKRAEIDRHWHRVYAALKGVALENEVRDIIAQELDRPRRKEFVDLWNQGVELARAVSWEDLAQRETVFALRMTPIPSVLILCHAKPGTGPANLAALEALLDHIASGDESLEVRKQTCCGMPCRTLAFPNVPVSLELFGKGDVIGVSTSSVLAGEVAALMAGQRTPARPIIKAARFRRGIELLHAPEDGVVFVDWRALAGGLRELLRAGDDQAGGMPHQIEALVVLDRIVQRLDILDYTVGVQWTEGRRENFNAITALQPEAKGKRLAKVKASRPPLPDPLSMVPVEANGFYASAGWDFGELYSLLLHMVGEDFPNGQMALIEWMAWQDKIGFNLEHDLLSWVSGEFVAVTMPAAKPGPFWTADLVVMLRVSDAELADRKLDAGIRRLQALFQERLMPLNVVPAREVRAKGFRTISTPMFAMLPPWAIGVQDDWLIAGTSQAAIDLCLATATGQHASVVESPRFQAEGIRVTGPVQSVSFTELGDYGAGMAQGFLMANFYSGLIAGASAGRASDAPDLRALQGMMRLMGSLQPVFAQIDFMSSSATVTTFDGSAWRTDSVVNYQAPEPQP